MRSPQKVSISIPHLIIRLKWYATITIHIFTYTHTHIYIYRNLFIYSHIVTRYCEIRVTVLGCGWDDFGNDFDSHSHKAGMGL